MKSPEICSLPIIIFSYSLYYMKQFSLVSGENFYMMKSFFKPFYLFFFEKIYDCLFRSKCFQIKLSLVFKIIHGFRVFQMSRPNLIIPQKIMKAAFWSLRDKIDAQIEAHLKFTRFSRPTPHEIKKIDTNQSQKISYRKLNFCDFCRFVSQKIHFHPQ